MMTIDVGGRLQQIRRGKNFSQRQLAVRAKIANATISQIEAGKVNPTLAMMDRIADGLGVSLMELLDGGKDRGLEKSLDTVPLVDAVEHLSEGFALFDSADRLVLCNSRYQDFYGYKAADLGPETTITDLLKLDIARGFVSKEAGGLEATEWRIRRFRAAQDTFEVPLADGRWLQIRDRHTSDGGTVSIHTEITARKKAEELTKRAAEAKSEFVAMVSHEVRTPMNGVLGMARLLQDMSLEDETRQCVDTIVASGMALLTIIDDLLDVSKLDADKLELEHIPFIVADVVDAAMAVMAPRAEEKGLAFTATVDAAIPPLLLGDPHRLRQVLLNLISNAIKFTDEGSVAIEVSVSLNTKHGVIVAFSVSDTGEGISQDAQEKLFAEYTQASMEVARRHGGTGLGLSISRRLIGMMGGEIMIESAPGEGSAFSFVAEFAIASPAQAQAFRDASDRQKSPVPVAKATTRALHVLQVEDNEINRDVAVKILTRAGHRVSNVENGVEAMQVIETGGFDIVLMDRDMPKMDGIEATRRIRALSGPISAIPIVGITASAFKKQLDECLEAGMNICLTKPIEARLLRDTLEQLAGGPPASSLPVLVIDDTEINRTVAAKQLAKLGFAFELADSGAKALKMTEAENYAAILVDITMPEMDGLEFLKRFRSLESSGNAKTPVIALTGHKTPEDRVRFLAAGMDDVLTKPVAIEELAQALKKWSAGTARESNGEEAPIDLSQLSEILGEEDEGELFEMLSLFTEQFPHLLASLQDAVADGNARAVRDRAHAAKSAATYAAAVPLSALLERLEKQTQDYNEDEDWDDIAGQAAGINQEYARVVAFCANRGKGP